MLTVAPSLEDADGSSKNDAQQELVYCFLQAGRLQFGVRDTLNRYETALWRQAAQLVFILRGASPVR